MAVLLKSNRTWATNKNLDEWLVADGDELYELPETVGPGSIAYTADLSLIAMLDETGTWQAILGTIPDPPEEETPEETPSGSDTPGEGGDDTPGEDNTEETT